MLTATDHARLLDAVTAYDRRAATTKAYNRFALAHYARGLTNVRRHVQDGATVRDAIITEFVGRLADRLLRAVGCDLMTKDEARFGLAKRLPTLPDDDE